MEILRCLLLPIYGKTLMVPYSAVAEVVALPDISPYSQSKNWVLGKFNWRDFTIPLVCLEMNEKESSLNSKPNMHVAILNRMLEGDSYPDFIGILLQTIPVMKRFKRSDVTFVAKASDPYLLMEVKARDKPAYIPNIEWIDEKLKTI